MELHKILKYVALALGVIGTLLALLIMSGSEGMIDNMLYVTYLVLAIVIALILIYVIKGLFAGNIKKTLTTVGLFLAVILISYLISSGTDLNLDKLNEKGLGVTETVSKNVGAGLYAFYFLMVIAIASIFLSGAKKLFKK
jgi:uncharacterized membrane protein YeaQ/YmgE (transglycosylase-associated protein family)